MSAATFSACSAWAEKSTGARICLNDCMGVPFRSHVRTFAGAHELVQEDDVTRSSRGAACLSRGRTISEILGAHSPRHALFSERRCIPQLLRPSPVACVLGSA